VAGVRPPLDLRAVPLIDGHCHSIRRDFRQSAAADWLRIFTEGTDPRLLTQHVPASLTCQRALRDLAAWLDCAPTPEAILAARGREPDYLRRLCRDAHVLGMLVDTGYPPGTLDLAELQRGLGCRIGEVVRLETLEEELVRSEATFAGFEAGFREALRLAKERGAVALKSIVAYRSGLAVRPASRRQAAAAFRRVRRQVERRGPVRLTAKPLLDYCLLVALEEAIHLELPLQLHTGFGDPDIDLMAANPALLRPLLHGPAQAGVPIVLLHMGYPYVREAAYLASVYPQIYVDISLATPLLSPLLPQLLSELLGLAPSTKIVYGSDGHSQPEMFWLGARYARWALGMLLTQGIDDGVLTVEQARQLAEAICYRNAWALYSLGPEWAPASLESGAAHAGRAHNG
jgi:predicted TIM-barrel fold metal-dependent hydrolase